MFTDAAEIDSLDNNCDSYGVHLVLLRSGLRIGSTPRKAIEFQRLRLPTQGRVHQCSFGFSAQNWPPIRVIVLYVVYIDFSD